MELPSTDTHVHLKDAVREDMVNSSDTGQRESGATRVGMCCLGLSTVVNSSGRRG